MILGSLHSDSCLPAPWVGCPCEISTQRRRGVTRLLPSRSIGPIPTFVRGCQGVWFGFVCAVCVFLELKPSMYN